MRLRLRSDADAEVPSISMHDSGPLSCEAEATWNGMLADEGCQVKSADARVLV